MLTPILPVGADGRLELPPVCATGAPPERTETLTLAKSLAFCGDVELSLNTPLPPADASAEVLELMHSTHCWVGPLGLTTSSEPIVVDWLDKGARAVLIDPVTSSTDPTEMRTMLSALPKDRLALVVCWEGARTKQGLQAAVKEASTRLLAGGTAELTDVVGTLHVRIASPPTSRSGAAAETGAAVGELLRALGRALGVRMRLGFDGAPPSVADVGALHTLDVSAHATVALATPREQKVSMQAPASVAAAVVACARTDRSDGLLTTVVVDESGICLGPVYSSAESVQESVRVGRGVYYSRSRSSLWRKGDTSGAWQQLVAIAVDCDSDALRYTVRQHGTPPAFCHLGTRTCWGEAGGLYHLQQTLAERLKSAPAGSYTKKLFDDPTLLRHKLLEEAQELIEATEPDHVAAEAADVCYFMLTRCVAAGVTIADIEAHLNRRSLKVKRRPGLAKPARVKAAEEALAQPKRGAPAADPSVLRAGRLRCATVVGASALLAGLLTIASKARAA